MGEMVPLLIAFMQQAQMVFRTADVIIRRSPIQSLLGWLAAPSRMMPVTTKGFGKWLHAAPAGMKCAPLWLSRPLLGGGLPESGS